MDQEFPFPFEPYPIQKYFMKELYNTIQNKKAGIFESPTGTGKSLSISCGALKWLHDNLKITLENLEKDIADLKLSISTNTSSDNWLEEEYERISKNKILTELLNKLDRINRKQKKYEQMKFNILKDKKNTHHNKNLDHLLHANKKQSIDEKGDSKNKDNDVLDDEDLLLGDVQEVADGGSDEEEHLEELQDDDTDIKIYISSRTLSQLSQFAGEIKRSPFGSDTRVVTLASRQHLCINNEVVKLNNIDLINERCLEMQKTKAKSTSTGEDGKVLKKSKPKSCKSCPYYNQSNINRLKERMLVDIMDMEDAVKSGKDLKACPYYASKLALDDAQVVLVSHAAVTGGGRAALGVRLRGAVLVVDEAHGLVSALERAHAAPLSHEALRALALALRRYTQQYAPRLTSANLLALNQIAFVVARLAGLMESEPVESKGPSEPTKIYTLEDFVIKAEIDHLNFQPLIEFCKKNKLAPKLHGFYMRYCMNEQAERPNERATTKNPLQNFLSSISKEKCIEPSPNRVDAGSVQSNDETARVSAGGALYALVAFLERLCERSALGRVLVHRHLLKYLLLDPAQPFRDLVADARSVVVAGGTMEPVSEFEALLGVPEVAVVRCGHVVPAHHVLALCLSRGPAHRTLNFSYDNRDSKELLDEVCRILRNLCSVVPGGIVCFLPSYSYEKVLYSHMETGKIVESIERKKRIFREPKAAADVDAVLGEYARAAKATGALMLSVVGGKLSEGLNFSDELGRCVVVVGMPYPNIKSVELQEKMNYLDRTCGRNAGNAYYENLCMKAVNQCIGRAVRHARDYASVVLADERYSRAATLQRLPAYIQVSRRAVSIVKIVNAGRAVRHARDYASVVLADERYSRAATLQRLPAYIQVSRRAVSIVMIVNAGRAVRHARDYASVVLADERYSRAATLQRLPAYIQVSRRAVSIVKIVNAGHAVRHARDYASVVLADERYSRAATLQKLPAYIQVSRRAVSIVMIVNAGRAVRHARDYASVVLADERYSRAATLQRLPAYIQVSRRAVSIVMIVNAGRAVRHARDYASVVLADERYSRAATLQRLPAYIQVSRRAVSIVMIVNAGRAVRHARDYASVVLADERYSRAATLQRLPAYIQVSRRAVSIVMIVNAGRAVRHARDYASVVLADERYSRAATLQRLPAYIQVSRRAVSIVMIVNAGRAVRHARDYASVVLADERYSRAATLQKLPAYIQVSRRAVSIVKIVNAGRAVRHARDYARVVLADERYSRAATLQRLPAYIQVSRRAVSIVMIVNAGRAVRHARDYASVVLADERYSRAATLQRLPAYIQVSRRAVSIVMIVNAGRAVRHARDYASVVLADERYSRAATLQRLPAYIQKSLISDCSFGPALGSIAKFFARHRNARSENTAEK